MVRSSVPWPSICTVRRNIQLTKSARWSAFRGQRFTSMSRRVATHDVQSHACCAESATSARYPLSASALPTLRSIRPDVRHVAATSCGDSRSGAYWSCDAYASRKYVGRFLGTGKSRSPVDRSSLLPRRLGGRRILRALGLPLLHLVRFVRRGVEIDKPVEGLGVPDSQGRPTDTRFGASRILRDALLTPDLGRPGFSGTPTSPFENGRGSADRARRTVNAKRATRIVTVAGRRYNPLSLLQGSPVRNSRFNAR